MKKLLLVSFTLILTTACTTQTQSTQHKPSGTIEQQVLGFYQDANELQTNIEGTFHQGVSRQSLQKLDLSESLIQSLQDIRAKALTLHPSLQTAPVWLAEKSQLVDASQVGEVTDDVHGVFIFGTVAQDDPSKMAWVAQIVIDMDSQTVLKYLINPALQGGFVPADHLVQLKDGELPIYRRVEDAAPIGPQARAGIGLELVQYTSQGPTIITD